MKETPSCKTVFIVPLWCAVFIDMFLAFCMCGLDKLQVACDFTMLQKCVCAYMSLTELYMYLHISLLNPKRKYSIVETRQIIRNSVNCEMY